MRISLKYAVLKQRVFQVVLSEIHKTLINNQTDALLFCPVDKTKQLFKRNIVTGWVIRIYKQQVTDTLVLEVILYILCGISEIGI